MHRLSVAMQHVVGHVDHVGDRPHANRRQSLHQPVGARADRDAADHHRHVARAAVGIVELDLDVAAAGAVGVVHRGPAGGRHAPLHAVAEADGPVDRIEGEDLGRIARAPVHRAPRLHAPCRSATGGRGGWRGRRCRTARRRPRPRRGTGSRGARRCRGRGCRRGLRRRQVRAPSRASRWRLRRGSSAAR